MNRHGPSASITSVLLDAISARICSAASRASCKLSGVSFQRITWIASGVFLLLDTVASRGMDGWPLIVRIEPQHHKGIHLRILAHLADSFECLPRIVMPLRYVGILCRVLLSVYFGGGDQESFL